MIRRHIMWPPFGRPYIDKDLDEDSEEYKAAYKLNRHLLRTYEALSDEEVYAISLDMTHELETGKPKSSKETRLKLAMVALLEAVDVINKIRDMGTAQKTLGD